jgi:hypothetical protein
MKKPSAKKRADELRPEYDLSMLKGGARGKYLNQAPAGSNLMPIEADLAEVCPDAEPVNRALRLLVDTASAAAPIRPVRRANKPSPPRSHRG